MSRVGIICSSNNKHHKIIDAIRELTPEEIKEIGVIDFNELKDIPSITTNDFNIINGGYVKRKRKPNNNII